APAPAGTGWMEATGVDHRHVCRMLKEDARALLSEAEKPVRAAHPDLEVHHVIRLGDPRETLLETSDEAALLVVGTRGLGPIRHLLLGSVSSAMVKHARCPVAVVRSETGDQSAPVVAGIAGEPDDAGILDLAFRVAEARQLPLTVLHCFWDAVQVAEGVRDVEPGTPGTDDLWRALEEAVHPHAAAHPGVEVHTRLSCGMADERLLQESRHASIVVIGHRRKPFLNELVYGSIAPVVVERAACSVVVVPIGLG
ncbi:MAG TPA: universal stress protein, partial [Acidimicrobiales bacterium]